MIGEAGKVILLCGDFLGVDDDGLTFLGVDDDGCFDFLGVEDDVRVLLLFLYDQLLHHVSELDFQYHQQGNHFPPIY